MDKPQKDTESGPPDKPSESPREAPSYFAQLDPIEHREARDYLFAQEIVRREQTLKPYESRYVDDVPGLVAPCETRPVVRIVRPEDLLEPRVQLIRQAWLPEFAFNILKNPPWLNHPATRLVVMWSEWPNTPYFDIPREERLRRIQALASYREVDRLASLAYLINPHNPLTKKKAIIDFAITDDPFEHQAQAFEALCRIHTPELFTGAKDPKDPRTRQRGRGSVLDDLYAFAAHDLCQVQKLPHQKVIQIIRHPVDHENAGQTKRNLKEVPRPQRKAPG